MGMAGFRGTLVPCHHCDRLDRIVLLFHRARSRTGETPASAARRYGEEWQVHGGGFYHIQKYLVAPAQMPEHLTWFKYESYFTWISGFLMLCIVYYGGATSS